MVEECPENNGRKSKNDGLETTLCNFEKGFANNLELVRDLLFQSEVSTPCITDSQLVTNKKPSESFDEYLGPWSHDSSRNIWSMNLTKKSVKSAQDEILLDNVKKKKRIRDCDKLDLALDYTSCVNLETFEYQSNNCFYSRFKNLIRGIANENKKVRMNGFSQHIKGKMKTRADIVSECHEERQDNKIVFQADESEESIFSNYEAPIHRVSVQPYRQNTYKKPNPKEATAVPVASAPTAKHPPNNRIRDLSMERHKSSSATSSPSLGETKDRILNRERIKESLFVKTTVPYVIVEPPTSFSSKGFNKTTPSIPSKCTVLDAPSNQISCFGKSVAISSVLPPIGQKAHSSRVNNRKK